MIKQDNFPLSIDVKHKEKECIVGVIFLPQCSVRKMMFDDIRTDLLKKEVSSLEKVLLQKRMI